MAAPFYQQRYVGDTRLTPMAAQTLEDLRRGAGLGALAGGTMASTPAYVGGMAAGLPETRAAWPNAAQAASGDVTGYGMNALGALMKGTSAGLRKLPLGIGTGFENKMQQAQQFADRMGVPTWQQFAVDLLTPGPPIAAAMALPGRVGRVPRAHPKVEVFDEPLGLHREPVIDVALSRLSDKALDESRVATNRRLDNLERHLDENPDLVDSDAEFRRSLIEEQDNFTAHELEEFRRHYKDNEPQEIADAIRNLGDSKDEKVKAIILADIVAKRGNSREVSQIFKEHAEISPDHAEILNSKLKQFEGIVEEHRSASRGIDARVGRTAAKTSKAAPTAPTVPGGLREVNPSAPDPGSNMAGLRALFQQPESVGGTRPWRSPAPDAPAASASLNYRPVLQLDPSQPAEKMPRQPATPRGKQRGISTSTSVRGLEYEDAVAEALTGKHLQWAGGEPGTGFVGAGPGIDTTADLRALRGRYDSYVEDGRLGWDWYPRARHGIERIAGPDAAQQQRLSAELAATSHQTDPQPNLGFQVKGRHAVEAGTPEDVLHYGFQGDLFKQIDEGNLDLGPKTDPYRHALDPTRRIRPPGVNDIHQSRAWGMAEGGLTDANHTFMDAETVLATQRANAKALGGRTDWTPDEIQARAWVRMKATKTMQDRNKKRGPDSPKYLTLDNAMREAAKEYTDALEHYTVNVPIEDIPAAVSPHMGALEQAPYGTRAAYTFDYDASPYDRAGRDVLLDAVGMQHTPPVRIEGEFTSPVTGQLEQNPARLLQPLASQRPGGKHRPKGETPGLLNPIDQSMLDVTQSTRGYMTAQAGSVWNKFNPVGRFGVRPGDSNAVRIQLLKPDEISQPGVTAELQRIAKKHGLLDEDYSFGTPGEGDYRINLGTTPDKPISKKTLNAIVDDLEAEGIMVDTIERGHMQGDYHDYEYHLGRWGSTGQDWNPAMATRKLINDLEAAEATLPNIWDQLDNSVELRDYARRLLERDERFAMDTAGAHVPLDEMQRAREIIAREGFTGLRAALNRGEVLPAVAGPMLLVGVEAMRGDDQQGPQL